MARVKSGVYEMSKLEMCKFWAGYYFQRYFYHGRKALDWKMSMKYHDKAIELAQARGCNGAILY